MLWFIQVVNDILLYFLYSIFVFYLYVDFLFGLNISELPICILCLHTLISQCTVPAFTHQLRLRALGSRTLGTTAGGSSLIASERISKWFCVSPLWVQLSGMMHKMAPLYAVKLKFTPWNWIKQVSVSNVTSRVRARQFPAIISCTTIDWFHEWPQEALVSVSETFLAGIEYLPVSDVSSPALTLFLQLACNDWSKLCTYCYSVLLSLVRNDLCMYIN